MKTFVAFIVGLLIATSAWAQEQASQIQKVSAQLELNKSEPQTALNFIMHALRLTFGIASHQIGTHLSHILSN